MAELLFDRDDLVVHLSPRERFFAFRGDLRVPRTAVQAVEVVDDPFLSIRGLRSPGTAIPRWVALGTWRYAKGKDFVAVSRCQRGVVVTLDGAPFQRLVVSLDDPDGVWAALIPAPSRLEP